MFWNCIIYDKELHITSGFDDPVKKVSLFTDLSRRVNGQKRLEMHLRSVPVLSSSILNLVYLGIKNPWNM